MLMLQGAHPTREREHRRHSRQNLVIAIDRGVAPARGAGNRADAFANPFDEAEGAAEEPNVAKRNRPDVVKDRLEAEEAQDTEEPGF